LERRSSRQAEPKVSAPQSFTEAVEPYREALQEYFSSKRAEGSPLSEAIAGIIDAGGKRLRPVIAMLVCEAVSGSFEKALPVAAAFELAHSASLIQDDIIDESAVRHGQMATHKKYGETKAILISDMMIFEIFLELAKYGGSGMSATRLAKLSSYIGNSAKFTAEGEFFDSILAEKGSATEEEYVKLAELKTGSLFAAAAACGAIAGRGTLKQVNASYQFGRNLGISFQIRDDILDIVGNEEATGKPLLKDLQNNASNMVLIHALSHADNYQKQSIHSMLYKKWFALQEIQALMKTLDQLGSIDHSNAVERNYAAAAKKALEALPASAARSKLEQLTEGLGSRTK
jgi:geranylgeranyl diphosphate synthase type I